MLIPSHVHAHKPRRKNKNEETIRRPKGGGEKEESKDVSETCQAPEETREEKSSSSYFLLPLFIVPNLLPLYTFYLITSYSQTHICWRINTGQSGANFWQLFNGMELCFLFQLDWELCDPEKIGIRPVWRKLRTRTCRMPRSGNEMRGKQILNVIWIIYKGSAPVTVCGLTIKSGSRSAREIAK